MATNTLKLLCQAANGNRRAIVRYDNQTYIRVVEPHVIYSEEDGTLLADCYQIRGHTKAMHGSGFWKTFELNKINSVFLLDTPFVARSKEGFLPNQSKYLNNLIAMTRLPISTTRGKPSTSSNTIYSHARKLWWEVGSTIDKVLSDRDWGPKNR